MKQRELFLHNIISSLIPLRRVCSPYTDILCALILTLDFHTLLLLQRWISFIFLTFTTFYTLLSTTNIVAAGCNAVIITSL